MLEPESHGDADHTTDNGHVRNVEDGPELKIDEVDDASAEKSVVGPNDPVPQITDSSATYQEKEVTEDAIRGGDGQVDQVDRHRERNDTENWTAAAEAAERSTRIERQAETQRTDEVDARVRNRTGLPGEAINCPRLRQLIKEYDRSNDRDRSDQAPDQNIDVW